LAVLALAAGLAVGCAPPEDIEVGLGQPAILAPGQSAVIESEGFAIKFVEVIGDSRCPSGVTCIWQGEVSLLVEITIAGSDYRLVLIQPGLTAEPASKFFGGYELVFSVEPYPQEGGDIAAGDYRLHITINEAFTLEGGILATFDVLGESYRIFITSEDAIEEVLAVQRGQSQATIPSGRVVRGSVAYNQPWGWHIDPEDIHMAEFTIELCDGLPSQVEANLDYWVDTVQRFCPWSAQLVSVQDYR